MTDATRRPAATRHALAFAALVLAGCGGGGNPLTNPNSVDNTAGTTTRQKLSFAYFQTCVNDIITKPIKINGTATNNTCASSGCHDYLNGTGGAFRVIGAAIAASGAMTADQIRATDIYKNYYSAQGEVIVGAPLQSLLLEKPLVLNVLHGGGLIFPSTNDDNVKIIKYWIEHPVPAGQDEFSVPAPAPDKCLTP